MEQHPCTIWPCRRCDRAGRTSWRARQQWHAGRSLIALIRRVAR